MTLSTSEESELSSKLAKVTVIDTELDTSILVVGGGAWGTSTALELARRGYKDVTVVDPFPVPSPISAGTDNNKIMSGAYTGPNPSIEQQVYSHAVKMWQTDPVYSPFHHPTGVIYAGNRPHVIDDMIKTRVPAMPGCEPISSAEEFRKTMPEGVLTGDFPGWKGWIHRENGAGWVHAKKAIMAAAAEAKRMGVKFVVGAVSELVMSESGKDVIGVKTDKNQTYQAERTIVAAGAYTPKIVDLQGQVRPNAWTLVHIKMSDEEMKLYKDLPVLFNVEQGFSIEPDTDGHELKICDEHPGYISTEGEGDSTQSVPFARHQIPIAGEKRIRKFLQESMPQLANRPFSFGRLCWDCDSVDGNFLITQHPDYPSLVVAVAGSGQGVMHMPAIGRWVADTLEGSLRADFADLFRWRPEQSFSGNLDNTLGRMGGPDVVTDLATVKEWTSIVESS